MAPFINKMAARWRWRTTQVIGRRRKRCAISSINRWVVPDGRASGEGGSFRRTSKSDIRRNDKRRTTIMATDYSRYQYIKIEKDNGLCTLTLNRPDSLNSIVPQMHHELETIWVDVSEDSEVNAILLTGAGRAFCAGADVKGFGKPSPDGTSHRKGPFPMNATEARRIIHNILDVEQPI